MYIYIYMCVCVCVCGDCIYQLLRSIKIRLKVIF